MSPVRKTETEIMSPVRERDWNYESREGERLEL